MFEIIFLGTSASAPSIHRGLTGNIVTAGEHRYLVDCGEGTQRQILRSGAGFKKLNRILLAHAHLDHILGLGGLISTLDPDAVVLGGGLSNIDELYTLGVAHVRRYAFHECIETPILKNELGDSAGVIGAAWIGE